jgi:CheY-like chemotaxis protein
LPVVENEPDLLALLVEYLAAQGFAVEAVAGGAGLRATLSTGRSALVLLDIGPPEASGFELATLVRRAPGPLGLPFPTGREGLDHRLAGLAAGAVDHIAKPFEPRELLARIRAVLRRLPAAVAAEPGRRTTPFGRGRLDPEGRRLVDPDGADIRITTTEWGCSRPAPAIAAGCSRAAGSLASRSAASRAPRTARSTCGSPVSGAGSRPVARTRSGRCAARVVSTIARRAGPRRAGSEVARSGAQ